MAGDLKFPKNELTSKLTLKPKKVFSGADMEHDVLTLSDFYSDRGYAFVNVDPRTQVDPAAHRVDVTYAITPGNEVLIDRIKISGNTKTSDKVIRREIKVQEQEPYSASKIQTSKQRLDSLGYFQSVRLSTEPARQPDKINLDVNVQEGNTASFQVGGGYDSASSLFGTFLLQNTNLFGGGESAAFSAEIGFLFENLSVSYTEPWFLDMPLAVSLQGFDNKLYLFSFDQSEIGFLLNSGYPLADLGLRKLGPFSLEHITAGLGYQFESVGISNLSPFTTFDIQRAKGYSRVSEFLPSIRRFTVDNPTDPRSGSVESLDMEARRAGRHAVRQGRRCTATGSSRSSRIRRWANGFTRPRSPSASAPSCRPATAATCRCTSAFSRAASTARARCAATRSIRWVRRLPCSTSSGSRSESSRWAAARSCCSANRSGSRYSSRSDCAATCSSMRVIRSGCRDSITFNGLQYAWGVGLFWKSPFGPINVDIAKPINRRPNDQHTVFDFGAGAPL